MKNVENKNLGNFLNFQNTFKYFDIFQSVPKAQLERFYSVVSFKNFKANEKVFGENEKINVDNEGIYLITKGQFLLSKKKNNDTQNDKITSISKEISKLNRESKFLMKCLNGKLKISLKKKPKINDNNRILTKNTFSQIKLSLLTPYNIFGDIEYINRSHYHPYSITSETDSEAIMISYRDFLLISTEQINESLAKKVEAKSKMFSKFYINHINTSKQKLNTNKYFELKYDSSLSRINRNSFDNQSPKNHKVRQKSFSKTKINIECRDSFDLSSVRINTQETYKPKFKFGQGRNQTSYFTRDLSDENSYINNGGYLSMNTNAQKYLLTGIKYPFGSEKIKRKMVFHYGNMNGNLKGLLLQANPRNINLSIKK